MIHSQPHLPNLKISMKSFLLFSIWLGLICTGSAQTVLFDFGRHDNTNGSTITGALPVNGVTVGSATAVGDTVSYVWNSVGVGTQPQGAGNPTFTGFQDQTGASLGWSIGSLLNLSGTNNAYTQANGFINGGLKQVTGQGTSVNPSFSLLGKLAVANATGDYWFVDNSTTTTGPTARAGFTLSGLDVSKTYSFTMFGTRNSTSTRFTQYFVQGSNSGKDILQTSGTNIGAGNGVGTDTGLYDGNDNRTVTISGITPLSDGTISVAWIGRGDSNFAADFATATGNSFGYLNVMQVVGVPEPSALSLMGLGLAGLWAVRRTRRS